VKRELGVRDGYGNIGNMGWDSEAFGSKFGSGNEEMWKGRRWELVWVWVWTRRVYEFQFQLDDETTAN
jgi:hypothetical protein